MSNFKSGIFTMLVGLCLCTTIAHATDETLFLPGLNELPRHLQVKEWKKKKSGVLKLLAQKQGIKGLSQVLEEAARLRNELVPRTFALNHPFLKQGPKGYEKLFLAWNKKYYALIDTLNHIDLIVVSYQTITSNSFIMKRDHLFLQKILDSATKYRFYLKDVKSQMQYILTGQCDQA